MNSIRLRFVARCGAAFCIIGTLLGAAADAAAATINIVAFGASNTAGRNAGGPAWPEYLQEMLRAKGYDAVVTNAGVNGDTTQGMLSRMDSAVPAGTQLVILQPSVRNDRHRGGNASDRDANIATMASQLRARGIKVILFTRLAKKISPSYIASDGRHIQTEGHRVLAQLLLPQVIAAIGRPH